MEKQYHEKKIKLDNFLFSKKREKHEVTGDITVTVLRGTPIKRRSDVKDAHTVVLMKK